MKKLRRVEEGRVFGGVCTGLGKYLEIDPVIIRVIWLLFIFCGGFGFLFYLLSWIVIPKETIVFPTIVDPAEEKEKREA
jgi:phage shock protein C